MDLSGQLPKFHDINIETVVFWDAAVWRTPNTCSHACEFLGDCQETRDTKIHHFYEISDNFGYSAFLTSLMKSPDVLDWTLISTEVFLTNAFLELRTLSWSLLPIPEPGALLRGFQF